MTGRQKWMESKGVEWKIGGLKLEKLHWKKKKDGGEKVVGPSKYSNQTALSLSSLTHLLV